MQFYSYLVVKEIILKPMHEESIQYLKYVATGECNSVQIGILNQFNGHYIKIIN